MEWINNTLYNLSSSSVKDSENLLLSLKLNNQLQNLLENQRGDSNIEIEFTSLSKGIIYFDNSVFNLKLSESNSLVSCLFFIYMLM